MSDATQTQAQTETLVQRVLGVDELPAEDDGSSWGSQPGAFQTGPAVGNQVIRIVAELQRQEARMEKLEARVLRLEQGDA